MKVICLKLIVMVCLLKVAFSKESVYDATIMAWKSDPSLENFLELGRQLRGIARFEKSYKSDPDFQRIRDLLLSIPNHAQLLADEIRREQKSVASYPTSTGPRVRYDFNRGRYFTTLSLLPSPQSIAVLGGFLADDLDTPYARVTPGSDWGENPLANSFAASGTIMRIGLRDPPVPPEEWDGDVDENLAATRAWWEEIRTGRKSFSFHGGQLDYRFKPNGSWATVAMVNPPDDDPVRGDEHRLGRKRSSLAPSATGSPEAHEPVWIWITALALALGVVGWFVLRRKMRSECKS